MKKRIGILILSLIAIVCLSVGVIGCKGNDGDGSGKDPRVIIEIDNLNLVVEVGTKFTTPYAGVYDSNLDRVDGRTIRMALYSPLSKDTPIEESGDQMHISLRNKGVYRIVYSAYIGDEKDTSVREETITINVCRKLATPTNFSVSGKTLTWEAVENASGYAVKINGGEEQIVSGETFTNDIFAENGYYVAVVAKGDNINYIDSLQGNYQNRTSLKDGELMAFNDPNYELDIGVAVDRNTTMPVDEIEWLSEEECAGSTGGAVKLRVRSGQYGWGVFRVGVMENAELTLNQLDENGKPTGAQGFAGMEIRFKVDTKNYTDATSFFFNPPTGPNNDHRTGMYVTKEHNDQWQILQVAFSNVDWSGYHMYNTATVPTFALNGDQATWEQYNGAYGYIVKVTKTTPDNDDADPDPQVQIETYYTFAVQNSHEYLNTTCSGECKHYVHGTTELKFNLSEFAKKTANGSNDFYTTDDGSTYAVEVLAQVPTSYDHINLNLYNMTRSTGRGYLYLDYVRLYGYEEDGKTVKKLATPENATVADGKIVWDAVDKASRYTVNVTKIVENQKVSTYYEVNTNSLTLADIGLTENDRFTAEVRAIPGRDNATYASSDWATFKATAAPTDFTLDGTTLKWTAVENAKSYIVTINGRDIAVDGTSLDIATQISKGDIVAKVMTVGKAGYLDSDYTKVVTQITVSGKDVAKFDNEAYAGIIEYFGDVPQWNTTKPDGSPYADYAQHLPKAKLEYRAAVEGSNGGAVYFTPVIAHYGSGGGGAFAVFAINLPTALDLSGENYDGIVVRFKFDGIGAALSNGMVASDRFVQYVQLMNPSKKDNTYTTKKVGSYLDVTGKDGQWIEWAISNKELLAYYADGATKLTLSFITNNTIGIEGLQPILAYIDNIQYYNSVGTPENVTLNGTTLSWNAVTGANGYVLNVNGEDVEQTTSTSIDIANYLATNALITVKATSATLYDSKYSAPVRNFTASGNKIATFDHLAYEGAVTLFNENVAPWVGGVVTTAPWNGSVVDYNQILPMLKHEYQSEIEGSTNGALYIQPIVAHYDSGGKARHAVFTVNLPKALDLSGTHDGITVRFKFVGLSTAYSSPYGSIPADPKGELTDVSMILCGLTDKTGGYLDSNVPTAVKVDIKTTSSDKTGEWIEWKISNADLLTLYANGATKLVFDVYNNVGQGYSDSHCANMYLDYIEYYND